MHRRKNTYLVQKTVHGGGNDAHDSLFTNILLRHGNLRDAKVAEAALHDYRVNLLPNALGLFIRSDAEKPFALRVCHAHGQRLAANVEVDEVAAEVGREAAAWSLVLFGICEADGFGVLELEMGRRKTNKASECKERFHFGGDCAQGDGCERAGADCRCGDRVGTWTLYATPARGKD